MHFSCWINLGKLINAIIYILCFCIPLSIHLVTFYSLFNALIWHYVQCTSSLFVSAPAGVSLLAAENVHSASQFCIRRHYHVVEGDQPTKLCKQLLGQRGNVNGDLTLLDWTARGMCYTYSQVVNLLLDFAGGMVGYQQTCSGMQGVWVQAKYKYFHCIK